MRNHETMRYTLQGGQNFFEQIRTKIRTFSEEILECSAGGDPKIEYIWSRDGRIINPLQFKR